MDLKKAVKKAANEAIGRKEFKYTTPYDAAPRFAEYTDIDYYGSTLYARDRADAQKKVDKMNDGGSRYSLDDRDTRRRRDSEATSRYLREREATAALCNTKSAEEISANYERYGYLG